MTSVADTTRELPFQESTKIKKAWSWICLYVKAIWSFEFVRSAVTIVGVGIPAGFIFWFVGSLIYTSSVSIYWEFHPYLFVFYHAVRVLIGAVVVVGAAWLFGIFVCVLDFVITRIHQRALEIKNESY